MNKREILISCGDCLFTIAEAEKALDKQRKTLNGGKIND